MGLIENTQQVVSDMIDGEMMLLNMEAGSYYSLTGVAAPLWESLRSGAEQDVLLASLIKAFPKVEESTLQNELADFLSTLTEEQLLVTKEVTSTTVPTFQGDYSPPGIEKYTDLEDLLLIDPIHEADESGWPATAS